jgi:hypothetical protein
MLTVLVEVRFHPEKEVYEVPVRYRNLFPVLWIRNGFNADQDPAFFRSMRIRIRIQRLEVKKYRKIQLKKINIVLRENDKLFIPSPL